MAILFPDTAGQATDGTFTHTEGGLTWIWNGTSWRSSGGTLDTYILPTASTIVLGGVKVDGTTITISDGVITSVGGGGGGGTSLGARQTKTASTTASHANGTDELLLITGFKSYALLKATVSQPAWVRLYSDTTSRTADGSRSITEDPAPGAGVIAEFITTGPAETVLFTPGVLGFNNDSTPSENIYLRVQNRSGSAQSITTTLTLVQLEA
jgi:hypothetical protein